MKTSIPHLAAVSLALIPTAASSQYAYSRLATFALVESSTSPTLPAKDSTGRIIPRSEPVFENTFTTSTSTTSTTITEYGAKQDLFRISNRELLQLLVFNGIIDTIVGYSITEIAIDNSANESPDTARFYLTKRGLPPIDIDSFIRLNGSQSGAISESGSARTISTRNLTTNAETFTAAASATSKQLISMTMNFQQGSVSAAGTVTTSQTLRIFGRDANRYASYVPGAGRVLGLVGSSTSSTPGEPVSVIEGSITLGAGIPTPLPNSPAN